MAEEWSVVGKNFLITGGATGLGALYAERFLELGAEKLAILDINEDAGKEITKTLNRTYTDKAIFIKCDVSKEEEIKKSFEEVLTAFNRIDVIINNAGVMNDSSEVWRVASDVNWQGLVSFTLKGLEHMRKDEGGSGGTIINTSSIAGMLRIGMFPIYCGSKAAVLHFGRSLSTPEFNENTGIRILTIAFGSTDTPLLSNIQDKTYDKKISGEIWAKVPHSKPQSVESAWQAVFKMYTEGAPGTVWLSTLDKPVVDITSTLQTAFAPLEKLVFMGPE